MFRPKNCKKCGGKIPYQMGGNLPPCPEGTVFNPKKNICEPVILGGDYNTFPNSEEITTNRGDLLNLSHEIPHIKDLFNNNNNVFTTPQIPKPTKLQQIGIGMRAVRTGLGEIAGRIERGRQNNYDYLQQTALGMMNPMPVSDYQPNPYSLYAKYGGSLKKYQQGGYPTIYTSDKNDPRIKSYKDSLSLYNEYLDDYNRYEKFNYKSKNLRDFKFNNLHLSPPTPREKIKPVAWMEYTFNDVEGEDFMPVYKKPVQPIEYRRKNISSYSSPHYEQEKYFSEDRDENSEMIHDILPITTESRNGQPIYGPSNSLIGMYKNGTFYPDYQNIGKRTSINNADTELINNPENLQKYIDSKAGKSKIQPKFRYGGLKHVNYFGPPFSNGANMSFTNGQKMDMRAVRKIMGKMLHTF